MVRVIAIDGPAGSGKSTVAKMVADRLGFLYINTGAMYRAIALFCSLNKIPCRNEAIDEDLFAHAKLDFNKNGDIILNGKDVSKEIIDPVVSSLASDYSALPSIRKGLTEQQREIGLTRPSVLEGRDIGTVVFPDADYKFFVDASSDERAQRRFLQLKEKNPTTHETLESILKKQKERDKQDTTREIAPLKQAEDAFYIDTTNKSINDVVELIVSKIS